jgi:hypothetical protein
VLGSLGGLIREEDEFILGLLLPEVIYYALRFPKEGVDVVGVIGGYFNDVLEEGGEREVGIIFK